MRNVSFPMTCQKQSEWNNDDSIRFLELNSSPEAPEGKWPSQIYNCMTAQ